MSPIYLLRQNHHCQDKIIIEFKAARDIGPQHRSQLLNYLKATVRKLGLLVNFGHYPKIQIERLETGTIMLAPQKSLKDAE